MRRINILSEWSGRVANPMIVIIVCIMVFEVVMRYVFNSPTRWVHETSLQLFGSYSILSGAYVLLHKGHVRIDILYDRFSPRRKAILDLFAYLVLFLFVGLMLVYGVQLAWHSMQIQEDSPSTWSPPVYYFRWMLPIGAFLILLQGLSQFILSLSMAKRGKELA